MNLSVAVRLLMVGASVLMVVNWLIYRQVSNTSYQDRKEYVSSADTSSLHVQVAVDIIELQLERKEARIRQLEQELEAIAGAGGSTAGGAFQKTQERRAMNTHPSQELTVGWQWKTRKSRKVTFFDGNSAWTYATTYNGSMASPDMPGFDWWDKVQNKWWEMDTYYVYKTFLKPTSSFIDFGAWIGPTLLYGATLAKEAYGLEPDPFAFDELRANVALNPDLQQHTRIYWKCIMDKPGIYRMGGGGGDSMASVGEGAHPKSWMVDCTTLPQFIQEHQINNLDLIKIDTEGAEHIIVPSMVDWLRKQTTKPTLWLSIHKWNFAPGGDMAILNVLRLYKYVFEGDSMRIDLESYELCNFCTILATDLDVPIQRA